MDEQAYEQGSRAAWSEMLRLCLHQLGVNDPATEQARWVVEREAAVAVLRKACEEHGSNDWPDNLHLADVIEKYLVKHLGATARPPR